MSTMSTSSQNATIRRAARCSAPTACAKTTLEVACAASASARLSGISSDGSLTGYSAGVSCQSFANALQRLLVDPRRRPFDDVVAELGQRVGRAPRHVDEAWVDVVRDCRLGRERDAQPAGIPPTSSRNGRSGGGAQCASPGS